MAAGSGPGRILGQCGGAKPEVVPLDRPAFWTGLLDGWGGPADNVGPTRLGLSPTRLGPRRRDAAEAVSRIFGFHVAAGRGRMCLDAATRKRAPTQIPASASTIHAS
ncbi:unnamed protein product [Merluccius merluccius]